MPVEEFVHNKLQTQSTTFCEKGIIKFKIRWQKCINVAGNYVEK